MRHVADTNSVVRTGSPTADQGDSDDTVDPFWPDFNPRLLPGGLAWKGLLILVVLGLLAGLF